MNTMKTDRNDNETTKQASPPALTIDVKRYEHFLENSDLCEDQKHEFLQTLWSIICELVSLGFGVHPLQQIEFASEKPYKNVADTTLLTPDMLESEDQKKPVKTLKVWPNWKQGHKRKESEHEANI